MRITLDEIVAARRISVAAARRTAGMRELERRAEARTCRGFRAALQERASTQGIAVIAELKKASPSRGVIRSHFDVEQLAGELAQAGAAALSVLTEEQHFQGSLANLEIAARVSGLPCLRKDFIVDEFQIVEAKAFGADAILLIVAALNNDELRRFRDGARQHGLDVLCEVHDEDELRRAADIGFDLIGVNSRDLRTFEVDLGAALRLAQRIPTTALKVAESGIHSAEDVRRLRDAGFEALLIGESLMKAERPGEMLRELLAGARRPVAPALTSRT